MSAEDLSRLATFLGFVALFGGACVGVYLGFSTGYFSRAMERHRQRVEEGRRRNQQYLTEQQYGVRVAMTPKRALDAAQEVMTRNHFALESRTDSSLTFSRYEEPSCAVGCVLALFLLLPAILYMLLAGKTLKATCVVYEEETGCRIVAGGEDYKALATLRDWARTLPQAGEEIVGKEAAELPEAAPGQIDVPRQIRALADLRDSGLLTPEEFEAKKRDLLDRM